MKVLIIGSGGREHALAWRLASSPRVTQLLAISPNPGIAQLADAVDMPIDNGPRIARFAQHNGVDLVVIGPEDPLAAGLADQLTAAGIKTFGPNREAARIEADKWFAKELMRHQAVPTAEGRVFTDPAAAEAYIETRDGAMVVKAAGLAKGKGVTLCRTPQEAVAAVDLAMRQKVFGPAGQRVVIEEMLTGPECSILAFVDRRTIYIMEPSQDHKAVNDGDTGPMTGGMGAYSPAAIVTPDLLDQIERDILVPVVDGLLREGIEYKGVLYAGLMLTPNGPKVLEFNCRFGDPETQPLMMRLQSDLAEVMLAVIDGRLDKIELKWDPRPALCVVAASGGYPGPYPSGVEITGIDDADAMADVKVFHGGTRRDGRRIVTDGGRVLGVTAIGNTIADAQRRAYAAMAKIHFDGMHYRHDIGHRAVKKVKDEG
jgi:phosphoribosylamine--glycine ligase